MYCIVMYQIVLQRNKCWEWISQENESDQVAFLAFLVQRFVNSQKRFAGLLGCSVTLLVCWAQYWSCAGSLLHATTVVVTWEEDIRAVNGWTEVATNNYQIKWRLHWVGYEFNFCTYTAGWSDDNIGSYHLPGMSMQLQQATELVTHCGWCFRCKINVHPFVSNQFAMISHCIFTIDHVSIIIIIVIREGRTQNRKG